MMNLWAPDVEVVPDTGFPDTNPRQGREEYRRLLEEIGNAWVSARWAVQEIRSAGSDRVMERGAWGGVGVGSGIETQASYTLICTVQDGHIRRVEFFSDHADALKAVGLKE